MLGHGALPSRMNEIRTQKQVHPPSRSFPLLALLLWSDIATKPLVEDDPLIWDFPASRKFCSLCIVQTVVSVTPEQNTPRQGHLLPISRAKTFLIYSSKMSLSPSTIAAAEGRVQVGVPPWSRVRGMALRKEACELTEALEGHGQPGPLHPGSQRHLPLHHVRQLLFDGPVRVNLNGIIVVKELGELGQPTRGEVISAHRTGPT